MKNKVQIYLFVAIVQCLFSANTFAAPVYTGCVNGLYCTVSGVGDFLCGGEGVNCGSGNTGNICTVQGLSGNVSGFPYATEIVKFTDPSGKEYTGKEAEEMFNKVLFGQATDAPVAK